MRHTEIGLVLLLGLALTGCRATGAAGPAPATTDITSGHAAAASASPSLSVPGTHKSTTVYAISARVSTLVVVGHVGDVTVTGGGSATSVTEQVAYSKTRPVTTRTISDGTLTVTYNCPAQLVCGVAYVIRVPRDAAVQVKTGSGAIRLSGLAGNVTAQADIGLINATGLSGASVSLTTEGGGITAAFTAAPATVQAATRVGAITLRVPGGTSYQVTTHAHLGHATVSVPQSSSSAHVITATADLGAILVQQL
jgi:hypothetical protein